MAHQEEVMGLAKDLLMREVDRNTEGDLKQIVEESVEAAKTFFDRIEALPR